MTGSNIQLFAKNKQNKFLISGKPDCYNAFNKMYIKSNNYSKEFFIVDSTSSVNFGDNITFYIPKKAHYIYNIILKLKLPILTPNGDNTFVAWTNSLGHAIIDKVEFFIGEYILDTHDGLYMEIDDELMYQYNSGHNQLIGKYTSNILLDKNAEQEQYIYVPLKFWFNKNLQNALPIFLFSNPIYSHNIRVDIKLKSFNDIIVHDGIDLPNEEKLLECNLLVEYIFIEEQELKYNLLNSNKKEFIIKQVQRIPQALYGISNSTLNISLKSINHCVSEILFVLIEKNSLNNNDYFNFAKRLSVPNEIPVPLAKTIKFLIEGNERYIEQDESFYRLVLPYINHSNVSNKYIYILPFCNEPENNLVYTGSLNFSCLDTSNLIIKLNNNISESTIFIYAINYNVFFIENGLAGIRFIS